MDDLLDKRAVCRLLGGSRPINPSSLWRWIKAGRFPKPIAVGPQVRRWRRSDVEATLQRKLEETGR
jgi:prophage regulatory protein